MRVAWSKTLDDFLLATSRNPSGTLNKISNERASAVALAALASTAAFAQSSVTISGGMTLGVGSTDIGTAKSGTQIARQTGNLQFAGTEDLGGGLKAGFQFQTTLGTVATTNTDTAQIKQRSLLGDRAANMTLSGGFGTVMVGRANTAVRSLMAIGDASGLAVLSGLSASSSAAAVAEDGGFAIAGGDANARIIYGDTFANQVAYVSPSVNGFTAAVGIVPVQKADTNVGNDATNKDTFSYTVQYGNGPVAAAYNLTDNKGGSAPYKLSSAFASYDMGVAKIGLAYQAVKLATGTNPGAGTAVTASIPVGAGSIGMGYGKRSAATQTGTSFGDDVKQTFVGYKYNLSKRTNVQLVTNKIDRAGSATDVKETHVLLAHTF